ncbi:hypothetical protein MAUB_15870 [Mycolicibacterium aubagnense]|uniref:Uncharacterized protein n=1 Tax=Mycolicibacterium aubagnense TaxID=319707 RepID=A0ABM7IAQ6_9MYCO|nr:hypothetical protein MAUB_15870 [Mycolicibacterium aubagnense]
MPLKTLFAASADPAHRSDAKPHYEAASPANDDITRWCPAPKGPITPLHRRGTERLRPLFDGTRMQFSDEHAKQFIPLLRQHWVIHLRWSDAGVHVCGPVGRNCGICVSKDSETLVKGLRSPADVRGGGAVL